MTSQELKPSRPYHHGDLTAGLRAAAHAILKEQGLEGLSLRSVARRAGVSHAAPYRHYASREALLAALAEDGLKRLRSEIQQAAAEPTDAGERIVRIGGAYLRFASRNGGLLRLMFGSEIPNRAAFPGLSEATMAIAEDIGEALRDSAAGIAVWAAIHGLAQLILDNVIDLGQQQAGMHVVPPRAEILLRSLVEAIRT